MTQERETLEVDVLIVGGGPGGLATAYWLQKSIQKHNDAIDRGAYGGNKIGELSIVVLEKGTGDRQPRVVGARSWIRGRSRN
jgi:flavin-dependent dehydrogenase